MKGRNNMENIISFKSPMQKYETLPDEYKGLVLCKAEHMITSRYKGFPEMYNALTPEEKKEVNRTIEKLTEAPDPDEVYKSKGSIMELIRSIY